MAIKLTGDEKKLVDHAKNAVLRYNKLRVSNGELATIYAFVLSSSGKIYDGACLESTIGSGAICAERVAIGTMFVKETYKSKIKCVVLFDPVPKKQDYASTPCGTCRHVIWQYGKTNTTVLCGQYMLKNNKWHFIPKMEKYTISQLYPKAYKMIKWD